ncbi:hypothetical protein D0U02_20240 [Burkholderia pseudomallei]|uniref:Uncharacterized protein n=2 Tax=Burkholderia pseudomallei TaxID=28450 RepID=Q3JME6_BURP1|nr:hypothetical protein BURPS1710b_A0098 [Burkholderia pseudomallei 1710b]AFR19448.1 hypothetical protein BPC006_II1521 [Burkholderia pseudomallei BPC006]ARK47100.1 hypothetical protein BOC35_13045 [Burkholderia pseudomallei]EBA45330.1 hypothetical protein BURPS305_0857 [Burkholderia pseudomallei 305]EDO87491.1 hypothetical protein BURPS406E_G0664 [Burkholderia pseudomallei 406e]EDO93566.1 hypothetical protein BURPSPAST_J0858 [Burkholderia pseudomallei Pasteur 52237]EDS82803.1 hypothetical pr
MPDSRIGEKTFNPFLHFAHSILAPAFQQHVGRVDRTKSLEAISAISAYSSSCGNKTGRTGFSCDFTHRISHSN